MNRFNISARRVVDEKGRFVRVSAAEVQQLRSVAEGEETRSSRSPSNATTSTIPAGWQSGFGSGSPVQKSVSEKSATREVDSLDGEEEREENPTLARLKSIRNSRSGRFNELEQIVNSADMQLVESDLFFSLSNEYHSMGQRLDPLRKANKAVDVLCKSLEDAAAVLGGSSLTDAVNDFVLGFMELLSTGAYAAAMALLKLLGQWGLKQHIGTRKYSVSRKVLKCWREYAFAEGGEGLLGWQQLCLKGEITGLLTEGPRSTFGSAGMVRMNEFGEDHDHQVDFFIDGLASYLGFEQVNKKSAAAAYKAWWIDTEAEKADGKRHGLRMSDNADADYEVWLESFESLLDELEDAIEESGDFQYAMNEQKIVVNLKEGRNKTTWMCTEKILDLKEILWKHCTAKEAKGLITEGLRKKAVKDKNFKVFPSAVNGSTEIHLTLVAKTGIDPMTFTL